MHLVSFDVMRSHDIPGAVCIKPENAIAHIDHIRRADYLLFPEYWQVNGLHYGLKKSFFQASALTTSVTTKLK